MNKKETMVKVWARNAVCIFESASANFTSTLEKPAWTSAKREFISVRTFANSVRISLRTSANCTATSVRKLANSSSISALVRMVAAAMSSLVAKRSQSTGGMASISLAASSSPRMPTNLFVMRNRVVSSRVIVPSFCGHFKAQ